jgi:hypothetical protein
MGPPRFNEKAKEEKRGNFIITRDICKELIQPGGD